MDEDGAHLFFHCKEVKTIWKELGLDNERTKLGACPNARAVVQELLGLNSERSILCATLLWQWWSRRNKINAKEKVGPPAGILSQVRYWAGEAKTYCSKSASGRARADVQCWQRPEGDMLKINIDGAFTPETRRGGWGFVVRDQSGNVRGSGAGCLPIIASAAQAEAQACDEALKAAADWGMTNIILETDSQNLAKAMQSTSFDRAPDGILYRDMRLFSQLSFTSFALSAIPRTCNNLAKYGASRQDLKLLWPESLPSDVRVVVASVSAEPS